MADTKHVRKLKAGSATWNAWRKASGSRPNLRDWNFEKTFSNPNPYFPREFDRYDFSHADLHGISARNSVFTDCIFDDCRMNYSDLCFSYFYRCSFRDVEMRVTKIGSAQFADCDFSGADLGYCSAEETSFARCQLHDCSLEHVSFVNSDLSGSDLRNVSAYGISTWDLKLKGTTQRDIVVERGVSRISIDSIELAQFINLLLRNAGMRTAIETITSKVVLPSVDTQNRPLMDT